MAAIDCRIVLLEVLILSQLSSGLSTAHNRCWEASYAHTSARPASGNPASLFFIFFYEVRDLPYRAAVNNASLSLPLFLSSL